MVTKMKARELRSFYSSGTETRVTNKEADLAYLQRHYDGLLEKYRNHWIMISGGKLIDTESDPDRLMERLNRSRRDDMLVYYLADPEDIMLL